MTFNVDKDTSGAKEDISLDGNEDDKRREGEREEISNKFGEEEPAKWGLCHN